MHNIQRLCCVLALLSASSLTQGAGEPEVRRGSVTSFTATPVAKFNEPWAMTFLPDGQLLVTEKN